MKTWRVAVIGLLASLIVAPAAGALGVVETQPFPQPSPLLITAYGVSASQNALDFVQFYHGESRILVLDGWRLAYTTNGNPTAVVFAELRGYMLPESHFVVAVEGGLAGPGVQAYAAVALPAGVKLKSVTIVPPDASIAPAEQLVAGDGIYTRRLTTTGYSSSATFDKRDPLTFATLAADPLYEIPDTPALRIVEILPRSAECAPNDESLVCGDYVKLYNPGDQVVDASSYRLRSDSSTSESSNAFALDWLVEPGTYLTVHRKDAGDTLSLTDSGGYVWLEDAYGLVAFYDETMVGYPSAGSQNRIGWAWALDDAGVWQWTSTPRPDMPNMITVPVAEVQTATVTTDPSECPAGKYRNPDTNRCKNIEDAIATLVACDEGESRNPDTNRCRQLATAASVALAPCLPGQERNPATNRCRSVLSAVAAGDKPCPDGQERNPATNRCRAIVVSSTQPTLEDSAETTASSLSPYWLGAVVLTGAVGYGAYEWRSEIWRAVRKLLPTAKS